MFRSKFVCLTLVSLLLAVFVSCQVGYSAETLTLDDLPGKFESLIIESDSTLTIDAGEAGVIEGVLTLQGTADTAPELKIVNNGDFTIKNTVICNTANLTIQNNGNLILQDVVFTLNGNATLTIGNGDTCTIADANIQVYGGAFYFSNAGSLNAHNWYVKDQFDGTFIANSGDAALSETTFVVNGAYGKIEIFNSGDLQISHGVFDVNYGGRVNINTLTGTLTVTDSSMDVSGASHGKQSDVNILAANATWESCSLVNNGGKINYLNTGEVSVSNCTIYNSGTNPSTILSSSGPTVFKDVSLSGSGSTSITNWDSMTLIDSTYNSSHALTLMNNGKLTAENWLVKTTASTAKIVVYIGDNGTITFNVPFIENVSSSVLSSIGPDGQEFVESSGGTIAVTNKGSITEQADSNLIYILAIVVAIIVVIVVFLMLRKKLFKSTNS
ncbi:hypothetical protein JXA31_07045 [Candidatus Bathyarchaeota archaeon]|nr:hypothetical protein [Candidatus Bathyarchaeota archaeon]